MILLIFPSAAALRFAPGPLRVGPATAGPIYYRKTSWDYEDWESGIGSHYVFVDTDDSMQNLHLRGLVFVR